jgi:hypothetical protein
VDGVREWLRKAKRLKKRLLCTMFDNYEPSEILEITTTTQDSG